MLRKLGRVAMLTVGLAIWFGTLSAANNTDEIPAIDEIMSEAHNKKRGLQPKLDAAVKAGKWDEAAKPSARLKELGEALAKNKPHQGPEASWKKLSTQYKQQTAEIAEAVQKKDRVKAEALLTKFSKACDACHEVHRD
jgi:hypothetical protein